MKIGATKARVVAVLLAVAPLPLAAAFHANHVGSISRSRSPVIARSHVHLHMTSDPDTKKETTWDRITGPKLFKTVTNWNGIHSVPLVPLRILTGLLMIHHGSEGTWV
jgi:hypothetical protein